MGSHFNTSSRRRSISIVSRVSKQTTNQRPFPEGDITKRLITDVPDIDLYVCGFPCQSFSQAGKRGGFEDERGKVFWGCLEVIEKKQPKYFILENVKALLWHDKKNTFKIILDELSNLEHYGYNIKWQVLNTRNYGIPQNRERLFIIGTKENFIWPKFLPMNKLVSYVEPIKGCNPEPKVIQHMLKNVPKNSVFIDCSYPKHNYPNSDRYCSCLTTRNKHWCITNDRYMTKTEALTLQGFSETFNQVVSKTQIMKQIGNSMSVNVLTALLKNIINST